MNGLSDEALQSEWIEQPQARLCLGMCVDAGITPAADSAGEQLANHSNPGGQLATGEILAEYFLNWAGFSGNSFSSHSCRCNFPPSETISTGNVPMRLTVMACATISNQGMRPCGSRAIWSLETTLKPPCIPNLKKQTKKKTPQNQQTQKKTTNSKIDNHKGKTVQQPSSN